MNKMFLNSILLMSISSVSAETLVLNYKDFTVHYNCENRGYDMFYYKTERDSGNHNRYEEFHLDLKIPNRCTQITTNSYKLPKSSKVTYDRGHGVPQKVWDHKLFTMKETNYMTNIVPQESTQNRKGLWKHFEELVECYRDLNDMVIVGGTVWGNDTSNDYFVKSHGVKTPDALYQIMLMENNSIFALMFPNDSTATKENGLDYLVSVRDIEKAVGYSIPYIPEDLKDKSETYIPKIPKGCSQK